MAGRAARWDGPQIHTKIIGPHEPLPHAHVYVPRSVPSLSVSNIESTAALISHVLSLSMADVALIK